jgi:hypothetical protein
LRPSPHTSETKSRRGVLPRVRLSGRSAGTSCGSCGFVVKSTNLRYRRRGRISLPLTGSSSLVRILLRIDHRGARVERLLPRM